MAKAFLKKGIFITFEGPEGSGKSTHSRLVFDFLKQNYDCVLTREPGGTKCGEAIRNTLLHTDGMEISDLTELFLFEAARAQIVEELIRPSLEKRKIVVCDRFCDATIAYQGYGGGVNIKKIEALNKIATGGLVPDLTIILDIDTTTGLERASKKGTDRMELKEASYHKRVRKGYLDLAKRFPRRIKVIKLKKNIESTQSIVRQEVERVIQRYKRAG